MVKLLTMPLPQENEPCYKCLGRNGLSTLHDLECKCECHQPAPVENYDLHSHTHCWDNGPTPPCGIPLEKHEQCCLCDLRAPLDIGKGEEWENDLGAKLFLWYGKESARLMFPNLVNFIRTLRSSHTEKLRKEIEKAEQEGYRAGKTAYKRYTKGIEGWKKMGEDNGYLQIILKEALLNNEEIK